MSTRPAAGPARSGRPARPASARPASALRRGLAIGASLAAAGALATFASSAGAAPKPTVGQVQKSVNRLTSQEDQAAQMYDQSEQQLSNAKQRLALVNHEVQADRSKFESMRSQIAAIASTAYENGTMTSMGALLTSDNPQAVLGQASVLLQLSSDRAAQVNEFIQAARQLQGAQLTAKRTEQAVASLDAQRLARKKSLGKSLSQKKALLATLTAQQQQTVTAATTPGIGGTTKATNPVPVSGQAGAAVAYAYSKLGDPYLYGATGPGSFDCSGLVEAAWAAAGVAIPRTTYEQVAALPAVSTSNLQPGDLLFFDGDGHVGMYVGGGYLIDAPTTGSFVEKVALAGWYSANLDSAARP
ncbi:MAG TPA: NlpC/P60 family protein [Streptosporangiaceae bacterium]